MAEEQLTDELLERLLASASPEAYLSTMEPEDRTLSEYLFSLLHDKGLSRSEVFEAAGIDRTHGYQVFEGTRKVGRASPRERPEIAPSPIPIIRVR